MVFGWLRQHKGADRRRPDPIRDKRTLRAKGCAAKSKMIHLFPLQRKEEMARFFKSAAAFDRTLHPLR